MSKTKVIQGNPPADFERQRQQREIDAKNAELATKYQASGTTPRAQEIDQLVNEYNAAQAEQLQRLRRLYFLMLAGKGHRFLRPIWDSNAFQDHGRLDLNLAEHVDKLVGFLTEINPGID